MTSQESIKRCPICGEYKLYVIESRKAAPGNGCPEEHKRRRLECKNCGHRETTREISDTLFQSLLIRSRLCEQLRDGMAGTDLRFSNGCMGCAHNNNNNQSCDFGLPEYKTPEAQDCTLYVAA